MSDGRRVTKVTYAERCPHCGLRYVKIFEHTAKCDKRGRAPRA